MKWIRLFPNTFTKAVKVKDGFIIVYFWNRRLIVTNGVYMMSPHGPQFLDTITTRWVDVKNVHSILEIEETDRMRTDFENIKPSQLIIAVVPDLKGTYQLAKRGASDPANKVRIGASFYTYRGWFEYMDFAISAKEADEFFQDRGL